MLPTAGILMTWVWNMQSEVTNLRLENKAAFGELAKYDRLTSQLTAFESHIRGYTQAISDGVARPTTIHIDSTSLLETLTALENTQLDRYPLSGEESKAVSSESTIKDKVSQYFAELLRDEDAELAVEDAKHQADKLREEVSKLQQQMQQHQRQQRVVVDPASLKPLDDAQLERYIETKKREYTQKK